MRVLHVTPSYLPAYRYGGPIETVHKLSRALQQAGIDVDVATTNANGPSDLDVRCDQVVDVDRVPVRYFARVLKMDYAPSWDMARWLMERVSDYQLVHITSTFSFPSLMAGYAARARGVPYIVSPHGSLQGWSLRQKQWKKVPYWHACERPHLSGAAALHATADIEQNDILRVLPSATVIVVPNGSDRVDIPDVPRCAGRIVFLGRIHRKKGFDVLVPALAEVARTFPDVETIVAGPDEDGEWRRVEEMLAVTEPRPRVRYLGAIYGEERFRLLASSAVFVLPSHSENFGMTVLEAMACRTPVVVSRNCPWRAIEETGAGEWVDNEPKKVAAALVRILSDALLRERMGRAGVALAEKFEWPAIGREMADRYRELVVACRRSDTKRAW